MSLAALARIQFSLLHRRRGMHRGASFQGFRQSVSVDPQHHQLAANSTLGKKRVARDLKLKTDLKNLQLCLKPSCIFLYCCDPFLQVNGVSQVKSNSPHSRSERQVRCPAMPQAVVSQNGGAWLLASKVQCQSAMELFFFKHRLKLEIKVMMCCLA